MNQPKVTAVVLNYNRPGDTVSCVDSLLGSDYPNFVIALIDNGSSDASAGLFREKYGGNGKILLLFNKENRGFAAGSNTGIRTALDNRSEFVFLLNNDCTVERSALSKLVEAGLSCGIGITGPKIYKDGSGRILYCAGGKIIKVIGQPFLRGYGRPDKGQYDDPGETGYVTGSAALISRRAAVDVGLLDERYFSYFEDIDWNIRAGRKGYKAFYCPGAEVYHKGSRTLGLKSADYYYYHTRNRVLFAKKHDSFPKFWFIFIPYFLVYRFVFTGMLLLLKKNYPGARAVLKGFKDAYWN